MTLFRGVVETADRLKRWFSVVHRGAETVQQNAAGQIEIPLSRTKLTLIFFGSLAFVAGGVLIWLKPDLDGEGSVAMNRMMAVASILFFGLCAMISGVKFFDDRPGLIIDQDGIVDCSSAVAVGRIPWSDITEIVINKVARQRVLTIMVANHDEYLGRSSWWQQLLNRANIGITGSPVNISSGALAIKFDDLVKLLRETHEAKLAK